ncbi:hypothetical protein T265_10235 [Opisthorchis viverrini]|uniref:Uncharacterized protein n=1 Tax=Opisthorchis viverrini TaxID=6198 RepID=A0A074ZE19_OPIVI|nr:hypothetical protein T265_10235 [Opisthorchis viverrini]KER21445.1 hypothetical protein T265_10235 [Opisthorchis viverrini]
MRLGLTVIVTVLLCLAETYTKRGTLNSRTLARDMRAETCDRLRSRTETICSLSTLGNLPDYGLDELKFPQGHDLFRVAV